MGSWAQTAEAFSNSNIIEEMIGKNDIISEEKKNTKKIDSSILSKIEELHDKVEDEEPFIDTPEYKQRIDDKQFFLIQEQQKIEQEKEKSNNKDMLMKLDYILELLDTQKEIKTEQKNEEIVLYCFLGIFIIYILDNFVMIGKYSR